MFVRRLAQSFIGQIEFVCGFGKMPLQAMTKTKLAMKPRPRNELRVFDKIQGASECSACIVMAAGESQNIAQTFIQPCTVLTKPFLACARYQSDR